MIPRLNKNKVVARHFCRHSDEQVVQNGLAVTPSQMMELASQGIPISPNNLGLGFEEGVSDLDFTPPLQYQRGIDIGDLYEAREDSKAKIKRPLLIRLILKNLNNMEALIIASLVVGIFSAIAGFATSSNTNQTNVQLTRETNQLNQQLNSENNDLQRQLAAQANDWSLQQWNRENEYNSLTNQMSRLRQAGINPALAYSNGGLMNEAAGSPAANLANVNAMRNIAPQIDTPTVPDPLSASQIALNEAQAKSIHDSNLRQSELQPFVIDSMEAATETSRSLASLNRQSIDESMSRISLNRETASKLSEEAYSFVLDNKYKLDTLSMRERMVCNQVSISDLDVEYFRKNADQSLEQSKALVSKLHAEAQAALAKRILMKLSVIIFKSKLTIISM